MKKLLILFLSIFLLGATITKNNYSTVFALSNEVLISGKSAYVCDFNTNTVIYAKNENDRRPIASMTKIMLLVLAFENNEKGNLDFNESITVSEKASGMGGSQVFLQPNKNYVVNDLIKSIVIASANDASVAISEKLYGSEDNAVKAMNEKAQKLNLRNTLFSNCTGLTKPTQYSCAKDVAVMFKELLKYEKYYEFSNIFTDELTHPDGQKTSLTNTNKLVRFFEGCDGGKTGFTNEAGYCLAATAKRGSTRVISVIIDEPDSKTRFADCSKLFNFAFENYCSKEILSKKTIYDAKAKIEKGKKDYVEISPKENYYIFGEKNKDEKITIDFLPYLTVAPVKKGDEVGEFIIYKEGVKIGVVKAVANESVQLKTVFDVMRDIANA